jgi:pyruvate/2-oxoglutarate dehydrogenase complex dihydrolipoamide acyltransferase (E2) component
MSQGFHVLPIPLERQLVVEAGNLSAHRNLIHGLLEFDVTRARQLIHAHKAKTGDSLSFTAFLISCLAQALVAYPTLQAYRNWRNQLIIFDDVDVVTLIETEVNGVAFPHIIRAANRETFPEISHEIRSVKANPMQSDQGGGRMSQQVRRVPGFVRRLFYASLFINPHWLKKITGTVSISSVGMFAQGGGWGIGFLPFHTMGLTVGGISEKWVMMDGQLVPREYLCLTISLDHNIVDGAPAARFVACFKELVESATGIPM